MATSPQQSKKLVHSSDASAGGGTSPLVVSSHMNYGSFSGADIKVVVHIPVDREGLRFINAEKEANLQVIKDYESSIKDLDLTLGEDYKTFVSYDNTISYLYNENKNLDEKIREINNLPTTKTLAELQTLSWNIFREKDPVRTLGSVYPRAYTRGPRTIAGSMIFTQFYEHVLHEVISMNKRYHSTGSSDYDTHFQTTMLPDQLPPLDLTLIFANEYGAISTMGLYGVEFFSEGSTFSIQDIYSENTVQYVARDLDPIHIVGKREIEGQGVSTEWNETASSMLKGKQATQYGHTIRRNPYI